MFSESDQEEVKEIVEGQMEVMKMLVEAALESDAVYSIARLYRAMYMALRQEGFASTECIELMKHRDLINVNKKE